MTTHDANALVVTTPTAHYPVYVEPAALTTLPHHLQTLGITGTLWLVCDSNVAPHYAQPTIELLQNAGYSVHSWVVPAGESSKSYQQLWDICTWMIERGIERRDAVLALGGGVIGDLAGFAAATILRGIALVQLPTTLLAMVDAAIGGKTGINHPLGKNLIGAFHHPRLVLADTTTLATLPPRELRAGWAEVIKHAVIADADLFELLQQHAPTLGEAYLHTLTQDAIQATIGTIIRQAVRVKVTIVSADEHEQGIRIILNYGHTIGHALEAATTYDHLLHGEAVAIGMHAAAQIAAALQICSPTLVERQYQLLRAYGLPTDIPPRIYYADLRNYMLHDKKMRTKRLRWILPTDIGTVRVCDDVPEHIVRSVIEHTLLS